MQEKKPRFLVGGSFFELGWGLDDIEHVYGEGFGEV